MTGALSIADRFKARRGELAAANSKGLRPYKLKAGTTLFRIIPENTGDPQNSGQIDREFGMTYLKGFDGKLVASIGDREITFGSSDPIRDMLFAAMREAPTEEVKKHYQDMLARRRIIIQVLILNDKDQDPKKPVLLEMSPDAFDTIMAQAQMWAESAGKDIFSQQDGQVFQVEKSGTGLDTKYVYTATPTPAPLSKDVIEGQINVDEWLQSLFEGKEQRALENLQKLNAAAGITIAPPAQLVAGTPVAGQIAAPAATAPQAQAPQMVTAVLEDDGLPETVAPAGTTNAAPAVIEDAVVEPVPAETPVAPVATPVTPAAPAAAAAEPDLESILAALN